jgi:hypothetical protein
MPSPSTTPKEEALRVEEAIVSEIDEELRGAGVGAGSGEDDGAALVAFAVGIILNGGLFPGGGNRGIGADTKLRDEIGKHAEEMGVVEIVVLDEIVEAVCAKRSPCASNSDGELAAGGVEVTW